MTSVTIIGGDVRLLAAVEQAKLEGFTIIGIDECASIPADVTRAIEALEIPARLPTAVTLRGQFSEYKFVDRGLSPEARQERRYFDAENRKRAERDARNRLKARR